jgi:hypothetical protein
VGVGSRQGSIKKKKNKNRIIVGKIVIVYSKRQTSGKIIKTKYMYVPLQES